MFAVDQARVTGTLLALFLAKSGFSDNRAVSIVGYSLGSVVAFNCLKMLKRLHDFKTEKAAIVINDIQFWAGAYVLNLNKQYQEVLDRAAYCLVCNGHLNNLFSSKDYALKYGFPMIFRGQTAVGLYPIFEDIKEEDRDAVKLADNYNVTKEAPGHSTYGPNCG